MVSKHHWRVRQMQYRFPPAESHFLAQNPSTQAILFLNPRLTFMTRIGDPRFLNSFTPPPKKRKKKPTSSGFLCLYQVAQLFLHFAAVTPFFFIAPGDYTMTFRAP